MNNTIHAKVKLALQRALLGCINPSLRGIAFEVEEKKKFIQLYFFHDGNLPYEIENHYSCIDNEASADFFHDDFLYDHDFKVIRVDYPQKLPDISFWSYIRMEPFVDPS